MSLAAFRLSSGWHQVTPALRAAIPDDIKPWLLSQGSLTQQLTQYAQGCFAVQPISEGFAPIAQHESQLLKAANYQRAWVREVYLFGNQASPWVKARSVVPLNTLRGRGARLRYLNNRSLGSLLFYRTQPQCIRQVAQLPEGWARRSLYIWHARPLIVQEIFLPEFRQALRHVR